MASAFACCVGDQGSTFNIGSNIIEPYTTKHLSNIYPESSSTVYFEYIYIKNTDEELFLPPAAAISDEDFYVVPHKSQAVQKLVNSTIDIFWERRCHGLSWEDVDPPQTYFAAEDCMSDLDSSSRHAYKHLVFDLTAQVLRDIYKDEDEEPRPYARQWLTKSKYHRGRVPPATVDNLRPIVQDHVQRALGLDEKDGGAKGPGHRWISKKKDDRVGQILVQELYEDEPQWVNYEEDELSLKMRITDSLFDSLLSDTARALKPALNRFTKDS